MSTQHSGSCLCKKVQFDIYGEFDSFYLCHCKYCQKDTGSAHGANLFSVRAQIQWTTGSDNICTFTLPETRHTKGFCRDCGSAVPTLQMEGKLLVVPAGSLNTPVPIRPTAHIFCSSRASWDDALEMIKKFETFPSSS